MKFCWCVFITLLVVFQTLIASDRDFDLRMRQIRNYKHGRTGTVMLLYVSEVPLKVMWYCPGQFLPNSAFPDKIPAGGDNYQVSTMRAGKVHATILTILKISETKFPVEYTTIFYSEKPTYQYTINTTITQEILHERERLQPITWTQTPPLSTHVINKPVSIKCSVLIPEGPGNMNNGKLTLEYLHDKGKSTRKKLKSKKPKPVFVVDQSTTKRTYESTSYKAEIRRVAINEQLHRYEIDYHIKSSDLRNQGTYSCIAGRTNDQSVVNTWFGYGATRYKPIVDIQPCEEGVYNKQSQTLVMSRTRATCVRCIARGWPRPTLTLFKNGKQMSSFPDSRLALRTLIRIDGTSELVYVNWKPDPVKDGGMYVCNAKNINGQAKMSFKVKVN